jgi:hypothetical protein
MLDLSTISRQEGQLHALAALPPRKEYNAKHPVQRKIQFYISMTSSHPGSFIPKERTQCKTSSSEENSILYKHDSFTPWPLYPQGKSTMQSILFKGKFNSIQA